MSQDDLQPKPDRTRLIFAAAGALQCLLAGGIILQQLLHFWPLRWAQDDAYISFRYARNLMLGHGLVYNAGERVEGYTNFLWTLISGLPFAWGAEDPLYFTHLLGGGLLLMSYLLVMGIGWASMRRGVVAGILAVIPAAFHWSYNMWFFSGMETGLVSFFSVLLIVLLSFDCRGRPWRVLSCSLAGVLLLLARFDAMFACAAAAICFNLANWGWWREAQPWRKYALPALAPVLVIYLPYTVWRLWYYGSLFPNTYYAKAAYLPSYARGWDYLLTFFDAYKFLPFAPLVILGALLAPSSAARRFMMYTAAVTLGVFCYVVRVGGDFMEWRFVVPIVLPLYSSICLGAGITAARLVSLLSGMIFPRRRRAWRILGECGALAATAAAVVFLSIVTRPAAEQDHLIEGQEAISSLRRYCDASGLDWAAVGKAYKDIFPPDVRLATTSAGIIPYYSGLPTLDLHGLTNASIAREPVDPKHRLRLGHDHYVNNLDEMRARGGDFFHCWADIKDYPTAPASPPSNGFETVSLKLPGGRYTEFILLNPARFTDEAFRKDARLVFYSPENALKRDQMYQLRERLAGFRLIDQIDIENAESEASHQLEEHYLSSAPYAHNFHTKVLSYESLPATITDDDGRRVYHSLSWRVSGVDAGLPLVIVIRHDRNGIGQDAAYRLSVNGRTLEDKVAFPRGAEAWSEIMVEIPKSLLRAGANQMTLTREVEQEGDAELYFMWFLQKARR